MAVFVYLCVIFTLQNVIYADTKSRREFMPIEMELRLSAITDEEELEQEFLKLDLEEQPKLYNRRLIYPVALHGFNSDSDETGFNRYIAMPTADTANCEPEFTHVSMREPGDDPKLTLFPKCKRLEQCGVCCTGTRRTCQPVETETVSFKDCNSTQAYDESICGCKCTNIKEMDKCHKLYEHHWNSESCSCECSEKMECSTGTLQDPNTCRCEPIGERRPLSEPQSYLWIW